jgi:hypothetical protein
MLTMGGAVLRHGKRAHAGTNLVEAKALAARVPGEGPEKGVQLFRGIPKAREVLAQNDDDIWTQPFGFADELQLVQALPRRLASLHELAAAQHCR